MPVNTAYAGRVYPPTSAYQVGREKVREFASAVGATHPIHHDVSAARQAGYPDLVAPPTFAVIVAQQAEAQYINDPGAGVDFSRVVHAEEQFVLHRPVVAGQELVTVLVVESIVERAGLAMVTTRADVADATGAPVAAVTSTLAVRPAEDDAPGGTAAEVSAR